MKTCARKLWRGWWVQVAFTAMKWLLIAGILLAVLGIVISYTDNMARIARS